MRKGNKSGKISKTEKVAIGAISLLGLVGGWNIIGNFERSISAESMNAEEVKAPTSQTGRPAPKARPTIPPLAQIPRLNTSSLPTIAVTGAPETRVDSSDDLTTAETAELIKLSSMPSAAPLPTLAPLPALPEYVPPPPPPPSMASSNSSANNGSGGGNRSKGS